MDLKQSILSLHLRSNIAKGVSIKTARAKHLNTKR